MVFHAEEQIMELYNEMPTDVLAEYKAKCGSTVLSGMLTSKRNPTMNISSYKRPSGIYVFLQNNSCMLSFILQQPLYIFLVCIFLVKLR